MPRSNKIFKKRINKGGRQNRAIRDVSEAGTSLEKKAATHSPSASKRKLDTSDVSFSDINIRDKNVLVSFNRLVHLFTSRVCCKQCGGEVTPEEDLDVRNGLACKLLVSCKNCNDNINSVWTSEKVEKSNLFDVNIRLFYGLRSIGKGAEAGKVLCGLLNLT